MKWTVRQVVAGVAVVVVLAGVAVGVSRQSRSTLPEGLIAANGRLEGDSVSIASKLGGRIARIWVNEGDAVQAGQILVTLEDQQVKAKLEQADAAVAAVAAQLAAAQAQLNVMKQEVPLAIESAQQQAERARVAAEQAGKDEQRAGNLQREGVVNEQRAEQAWVADVAARTQYEQARQQLASARLGRDKVAAQHTQIGALAAQLQQAKAVQREAQVALDELTLKAPSAGRVMSRLREPGEVVAAGSPLLEIVNLQSLFLKVFIPENQIGKVRVGLPARIYSDAFPKAFYDARVRSIANRAEFTPKEVQTPDERVKLVFAVKLQVLTNPDDRLLPGLPADAVIRWQDQVEWQKPRW